MCVSRQRLTLFPRSFLLVSFGQAAPLRLDQGEIEINLKEKGSAKNRVACEKSFCLVTGFLQKTFHILDTQNTKHDKTKHTNNNNITDNYNFYIQSQHTNRSLQNHIPYPWVCPKLGRLRFSGPGQFLGS